MRFFTLIIVFTYVTFLANASTIKGILKKETGEAYALQGVYLSNGLSTQTNKDGFFQFTNVLKGEYDLSTQVNGQNVFVALAKISDNIVETNLGTLVISKNIQLQEAQITAEINRGIERMPDVKDNVIYAGKKTEVVQLSTASANLAQNNTRQVFAKVPGIQVWESDGSGVQMGIASRGLSPNRMWEFNTRQNGYDISADPFGYPEAYFTPSVESLDRIEIIRGAASLQFGPQFGGVVNFIKKRSVSGKKVGVESMQTLGSNGMFSTFNAVGGTIGKFSYYTNINYRRSDGWRANNGYNTWNGFVNMGYQFSKKLLVNFEYSRMNQLVQQPGGLTDSAFKADAQQSMRNRNWFDLKWNIAALNIDYQFTENNKLNIKLFGLSGTRSSVGFLSGINIPDTIANGTYGKRTIDEDKYLNYGVELRHLFTYHLFGQKSNLAVGARAYSGQTDRIQNVNGNRGAGYDLSVESNILKRGMVYKTQNVALFAENIFNLNNRWSVTPGVRYEQLENQSSGTFDGRTGSQSSSRSFMLFGVGSQYKVSAKTNVYANFSQGYRPVLFSDITPATTDSIDVNLKDARGYNIDLGYRGTIGNVLSFDVSVFRLEYGNRIGNYAVNGRNFRTNIGTSVSKGVESYIEFTPTSLLKYFKGGQVNIFATMAFIDAVYTEWNNPDATKNQKDKKVENAPQQIHRFGLNYRYKTISTTFQYSVVGSCYADALNNEKANAAATVGKIAGYEVADWSVSATLLKRYKVNAGINNVFDTRYFTRRSGGYPGPGILPADGRIWYVGVGVKI
jgi:Fe(3+) dicitrate transport protein